MRALCWHGKGKVRVETTPDPKLINPRDAIVQVRLTAICGSDLHLYDGMIPTMEKGDILGHEFMGKVEEVGSAVKNLSPGDRVVAPFVIACGDCFFCKNGCSAFCDNSNPNAGMAEKTHGHSLAGMFGYSHMFGGYAGGQAEYVRVPFADVGLLKVPPDLSDEQVLFLSDILPTGYMAAENCQIQPGDTVAVWGCGPVGQMAIKSACLLGAERVIGIDAEPARRALAERASQAATIESGPDAPKKLIEMTGGRGPDACIDAVGMEAHARVYPTRYDQSKRVWDVSPKSPHVLTQAILACRKGGIVSVPGVYAGALNHFPFGAAFAKGLTFRMGQTHVHRHMRPLLQRIEKGELDPSFVITHRMSLEEAPAAYGLFNEKEDGCVKVVLKP